MSLHERNYNMQMNKTILRNSEMVIFDKKNNFAAAWVSSFFPIFFQLAVSNKKLMKFL